MMKAGFYSLGGGGGSEGVNRATLLAPINFKNISVWTILFGHKCTRMHISPCKSDDTSPALKAEKHEPKAQREIEQNVRHNESPASGF